MMRASWLFAIGTALAPGVKSESNAVDPASVPSAGPHVGSHGGTVIIDAHGPLVVERNAGAVVRADREGAPRSEVALHPGLGEIVHDGAGAIFVADRTADRVVRLRVGEDQTPSIADEAAVPEPYGLALDPDGDTLLVTSVSDHELVAIATADLSVRWRVPLASEPRGVAVDAAGERAVIGFLASGALATVDLASEGERVRWHALDPRDQVAVDVEDDEEGWGPIATSEIVEARSRYRVPSEKGRRYARNGWAVAFVGHDRVIAAHEIAIPQIERKPRRDDLDSYGGGAETIPPLSHVLSTVALAGSTRARVRTAPIAVHQPRALAYDRSHDTLYVGGYGDDRVAAVADASGHAPYVAWTARVGGRAAKACGVDGIAIDGSRLWIHCELARRLVHFDVDEVVHERRNELARTWTRGPELAASLRSPVVERGAELFRRAGDHRLSDGGALACSSCHPEGRADGLTWRLGPSILQTPMLAGRTVGTAPFKWDGQDKTIRRSIQHTIERLGGFPHTLSAREVDAIAAYVQTLPRPKAPQIADADAVARGRALFEDDLACIACHDGEHFTDSSQYPLATTLPTVDTPSLVGLAHTAPYYHDGSAQTLHALLTDKATIHDMADFSGLTQTQIADLTLFLESL
jgi:mono/diheme cytochrome c family protein